MTAKCIFLYINLNVSQKYTLSDSTEHFAKQLFKWLNLKRVKSKYSLPFPKGPWNPGYIWEQKGEWNTFVSRGSKNRKISVVPRLWALIKRTWLKEIKVQIKVRKETDWGKLSCSVAWRFKWDSFPPNQSEAEKLHCWG